MTIKTVLCFFFFLFLSCGIARQRIEIPDYLIVQNGKETTGIKTLNAFIFENNLNNIPFHQYITSKFKSDNLEERTRYISIGKDKFKLFFYDYDEFEKYFGTSNYLAINQETSANKQGNQSKFIAISIINNQNEDCLKPDSLYQNIAISYLKKLKDDYLKNNGQL
jgi:hypothetical protein